MILNISFKTPDVLEYPLLDVPEEERDEVEKKLKEWIEYGECLYLRYDTVNDSMEVIRKGT